MKDQAPPSLKWTPNGYATVAYGVDMIQYIIHWDLFSATLDFFPADAGKSLRFESLAKAKLHAEVDHSIRLHEKGSQ